MCVADAASDAGTGTAGTSGGHCVQNQACILNSHWDSTLCKCIPDASDAGVPTLDAGAATGDPCTTATDCHGVLPHICATCAAPGSDAGLTPISGCAHWACKSGHCQTTLCD